MPDFSRHSESRNFIESVARYIPGFKGYLEREYRRDSDELARMAITDQLQKLKTALDRGQHALLDAGQIDILPQCERLRSRIDLMQSRVKGAMRGYSGFFDYVRVDEQLLEQVYQLDLGLLDHAAALVQTTDQFATPGTASETISKLSQQLDELSRDFDKRTELLEGIK